MSGRPPDRSPSRRHTLHPPLGSRVPYPRRPRRDQTPSGPASRRTSPCVAPCYTFSTRMGRRVSRTHTTRRRSEMRPALISSGRGRFRPRARLIRTIGAELISSEIVAIIELLRNSYDADASKVQVRFTNTHLLDQAGIEIADDGHGMTREVLLGPWLEPATAFKESGGLDPHGGERSPRGRRRLGSKGVGRFAAQRLGSHLLVRTSAGSRATAEAEFDWRHLDRADRYSGPAHDPMARGSIAPSWLARDLTDNHFAARPLDAGAVRAASPRARATPRAPPRRRSFSIELVIDGQVETIKPVIEAIPAMYSVRGEVGTDGLARIRYRDIFGIKEKWDRTVLWPASGQTCGPFTFRISAWDLDRAALDFFLKKAEVNLGPRDFRRTIRDHSGVSLYRDGFRILPYGEPDNDWLRLDRRRVNNPTLRLSNNQVLGSVQISADEESRAPRPDQPRGTRLQRCLHPPAARADRAAVVLRD